MWDERSPKETQREREYRREILDERDALERKIEALEAENDRLREALREIEGFCYGLPAESFGQSAYRVARAALTQREGGEDE